MSQPAKKPRGRPKRAAAGTVTTVYATEPTPGLKSAVSRPASKVTGTLKKTVTFEEPEKENMLPDTATKPKTETTEATAKGMRAKPVRKPTTASGRTTRASARAAATGVTEKKPLSPRKDVQNRPLSRDAGSDDELAGSEKSAQSPGPIFTSVLSSPARRPPPSPFKNTMMSPAKRLDSIAGLFGISTEADEKTAESPTKTSMLQSPAKRPHMPLQAFQFSQESAGLSRSPLKSSLLGTPAKRPASPMKLIGTPIPPVEEKPEDKPQETPKAYTPNPRVKITEEELQAEIRRTVGSPPDFDSPSASLSSSLSSGSPTNKFESLSPQLEFPGRLSAVLPRHADPVLNPPVPTSQEQVVAEESPKREANTETTTITEGEHDEFTVLNDSELPMMKMTAKGPAIMTTPKRAAFGLRAKDLRDDASSDSEDELALSNKAVTKHQDNNSTSDSVPVTPAPPIFRSSERKITGVAARAASRAIRSVSRANSFGYTPLSVALGAWRASSPMKATPSHKKSAQPADETDEEEEYSLVEENDFPAAEPTAAKGFFDEEMKIRDDREAREEMEREAAIAAMEALVEADIEAQYAEHANIRDFGITVKDLVAMSEDVEVPEVDTNLMKANLSTITEVTEESGMSLINIPESEKSPSRAESLSAASQEYGDENAVPIDPALFGNESGATSSKNNNPVTPKRSFASREVHTVSKVPLKRGDDSPPRDGAKRHCSTASRVTSRRPSGPFSGVTLPSSKRTSMGTPSRAARTDLDPMLLRGAIVFVDVHTTEGADAGRIFVDLLNSMGARCVKSWPWNPVTTTNDKVDISRIGITHVVFKDGGKRTLEKINESRGAIECVGVSWVLE